MAQMNWNEACKLDPSLLSLTSIISEPTKLETLSGLSNVNWKLTFQHESPLVWRPVTAISEAFSVSRMQEYQVLKLLEDHHLLFTPKAHLVNRQGILVEWLDGEQVQEITNQALLRLAVNIHQVDLSRTPIVPFSFTARIDHYWLKLHGSPHISPEIIELYQKLRLAPLSEPISATLCHFDLGCHNLIKSHLGYQVIDWEYSSVADPRIELAMLIETLQADLATFVAQYCTMRKIEDIDGWIATVRSWIPRVRFMALLWYYLAHQYWQEDHYLTTANVLLAQLCSEDHCLINPNQEQK